MKNNILKNIIKSNQIDETLIIKALEIQIRDHVSLSQVVVDNKLLSGQDFLAVSLSAIDNNVELSKEVKRLFPDVYENAQRIKAKGTRGIFTILRDEGIVSSELLEKVIEDSREPEISEAALESLRELEGGTAILESDDEIEISEAALESLRELEGTSSVPEINEAALESLRELEGNTGLTDVNKDEDETVEISDAALESLRELGGVSDEELNALSASAPEKIEVQNDLLVAFDEKRKNKIFKILKMIEEACQNGGDAANYLNSLYREVHIVSTAAKNINAKFLYRLFDLWEHVIDRLFNSTEEKIKQVCQNDFRNFNSAVELDWEIRENEIISSEEIYFSNDAVRSNYLTQINIIKKILSNSI